MARLESVPIRTNGELTLNFQSLNPTALFLKLCFAPRESSDASSMLRSFDDPLFAAYRDDPFGRGCGQPRTGSALCVSGG